MKTPRNDLANRISRRYKTAKVLRFSSPVGDWWVRVRVLKDDRKRAEEVAHDTRTSEGKSIPGQDWIEVRSWIEIREPRRLTALVRRIFRRLLVGPEFLGHRFQRGIELHETVLDCGVIFMTLPAGILGIGLR